MPFYAQIIILSFIAIIWIWLPISFFASIFLGWYDLARHFPRQKPGDGAAHGNTSITLPPFGQYKHVILYSMDDDHLHLRTLPIFFFHRAMSIPWAEIEVIGPHPTDPGNVITRIRDRDVVLAQRLLTPELQVREAMDELPEHALADQR